MTNDSEEQDYIDAQDFEIIEDLRKVKDARTHEQAKSQFLPFFFVDFRKKLKSRKITLSTPLNS